jgi:hypothetical protein
MKKWIGISVGALVALVAAMWIWHEFRVDRCLDAGGRWDAGAGQCDRTTP